MTDRGSRAGASDSGGAGGPRLRETIKWVLRAGILLSAGLLVVGLIVVYLSGVDAVAVTIPSSTPARGNWGPGLLFAGVLVLVLTPVVRVGASLILIALGRDRKFTVITLFVFLLLVITAATGVYR